MISGHANLIVASRLLVLQSKQLMLISARRRALRRPADEQSLVDLERHESALAHARARYNETVLRLGSPDTAQYRLIAYGTLVAKAERLRTSLLQGQAGMSIADRREVKADVAVLESILETWRTVTRQSMGEAVA